MTKKLNSFWPVPTKHFVFRHTKAFIFGGTILIALSIVLGFFTNWQFAGVLVGSALTAIFFIQKQRLDDAKLFHELFTAFNQRFAEINNNLNEILDGDPSVALTRMQQDTLNTYFDLCAEEFFFASEEYIYPNVWKTWSNGMAFFHRNPRIRQYWEKRVTPDAYYGFDTMQLQETRDEKN